MTRRARIILLAAEGKGSRAIAREIGVRPRVVSTWRLRFAARGIEGLKDKPRPGAKLVYTEATDKRILAMLDQPIPKGRARWTCELIAKALGGVDVNYVRRFLRKQKIDLAGAKAGARATIPISQPRPPISLGSTWPHPRMRSWCALTRSPRSKRSSVRRAT